MPFAWQMTETSSIMPSTMPSSLGRGELSQKIELKTRPDSTSKAITNSERAPT
jgi:hypothetical protein